MSFPFVDESDRTQDPAKLAFDLTCALLPLVAFVSPVTLFWPVIRVWCKPKQEEQTHLLQENEPGYGTADSKRRDAVIVNDIDGDQIEDVENQQRVCERESAWLKEETKASVFFVNNAKLANSAPDVGQQQSPGLEREDDLSSTDEMEKTASRRFIDTPPLALSASTLQCALWFIYAIGKNWNLQLLVANSFGIIFCSTFLGFYGLYCLPEFRMQYFIQLAILFMFLIPALLGLAVVYNAAENDVPGTRFFQYREIVGWVAFAFNAIMLCFPAFDLYKAAKTGRTSLMGTWPMNLTFLSISAVWTVQGGWILGSWQSFIPNAMGVVCQVVALVIRVVVWYRGKSMRRSQSLVEDSGRKISLLVRRG